jgi:L-rhamnonate dehydratase
VWVQIARRELLSLALPSALFGARDRIVETTAWSGIFSGREPARPKFASADDPARARSFGPFAQLTGAILVRVRTESGLTGYGLGGGGGAAVYIIERHLAGLLEGAHPAPVESLWDQLYNASSFYGRRGVAVMAMSGIDLALWDIAGKAAGKPVAKLLSASPRASCPSYYTGTKIDWALDQGFTGFKLPVSDVAPESPGAAKQIEARVAETRRKIGPEALLMIDCLGRWTVPFTLDMAKRLAPYRLHWIEEALMPDDMEGYARLCREVRGTHIASGEHEYTHYGFGELMRRNAVQMLQPDISWSGGLTALRRIAALAAPRKLPMAPHRGGSLYGLNFIAATPACTLAESFGLGENGGGLMRAMTPRFEKGQLYISDKPGFGVEIDENSLARLPRY